MTVSSYYQTNMTTNDPTTYKGSIDGNFSVLGRTGAMFSPYAISSSPNMTIKVGAGAIFKSTGPTLIEVAAQTSTTISAPSSNPRIDRVIFSRIDGTIAVVTGTPSTAPSAPAITSSYLPICQIYLTSTMTSITNAAITDERTLYVL